MSSRVCFLRIAVVVAIALVSPLRAAGPTSAEKLGYPPEARVVMFGVASLGWTYESNAASMAVLDQAPDGISAEVMAVGPWFEDVATWRKHHPEAELGVTLTLLSEGDAYRFGPAGKHTELTGLVDENGYLPNNLRRLEMNASPEVVEAELRAQIDRCLKAGIRPTHLMTHKGVLFSRVDLGQIYLRLAQEYWIPAVVVELKPEMLDAFAANGVPLDPEMVSLIASYPLPKLDELRVVPDAESYEAKRAALIDMLTQLPPGLTEIYFRPAEESAALKRLSPRWQQMVWDRDLLLDPVVRTHVAEQGIVLSNWREVMERFEGRVSAEDKEAAVEEIEAPDDQAREDQRTLQSLEKVR